MGVANLAYAHVLIYIRTRRGSPKDKLFGDVHVMSDCTFVTITYCLIESEAYQSLSSVLGSCNCLNKKGWTGSMARHQAHKHFYGYMSKLVAIMYMLTLN